MSKITRKSSEGDRKSGSSDGQKATADSGYATSNSVGMCHGSKTDSGSACGRSICHSGSSRSSGFSDGKPQIVKDAQISTSSSDSIHNDNSKENVSDAVELMGMHWRSSSPGKIKEPDPGGQVAGDNPLTQESSNETSHIPFDEESEPYLVASDGVWNDVDSLFNDEMKPGTFAVEVGIRDGIVARQTASLSAVVGYPDKFWTGRQFIRMIRENDRVPFGKYVTSVLTDPGQPLDYGNSKIRMSNSKLFCCLRAYRGLKWNGFSVKSKDTNYIPCQLGALYCKDRGTILIVAKTLRKAYDEPNKKFGLPYFFTTQSADCRLMDLNAQAVRYLGYLPHNVLEQSVLNFYHPEDWSVIKDMYDSVFAETNRKDRCKKQNAGTGWSKPYRFRAQNGDWVLLSTKFSIVFNIWTQQLHALIGKHRVLKGPSNPDVFAKSTNSENIYSDEVLKDWRNVEDMIKVLMKRTYRSPNDKQQASHKSKHLASFVRNFVDFVTKTDKEEGGSSTVSPEGSTLRLSQNHPTGSRTSTPPSYGQLNFRENIARYLLSGIDDAEPVPDSKLSEKPGERNGLDSQSGSQSAGSSGEERTAVPSSENKVTENKILTNNKEVKDPNVSYTYLPFMEGTNPLTREVLCRHNKSMAQKMILRHKERAKDSRIKKTADLVEDQVHGQKRSGSNSWEGNKDKYFHKDSLTQNADEPEQSTTDSGRISSNSHVAANGNVQYTTAAAASGGVTTILPLFYCVPTDGRILINPLKSEESNNSPALLAAIKPMPLLNPFAMFAPSSAVCVPFQKPTVASCVPLPTKSENLSRPQSQTTSIKPGPGSALGSAMMDESSENNEQDGESLSPNTDEEKSKDEMSNQREGTGTGDDSCYSLSSMEKTDSAASCNNPVLRPLKEDPPWLKNINLTDDIIYRYQMPARDADAVLAEDRAAMKSFPQQECVTLQLQQLTVAADITGLPTSLALDSDSSSCYSSEDDNNKSKGLPRRRKCRCDYAKLAMIHEELYLPMPLNATAQPQKNFQSA